MVKFKFSKNIDKEKQKKLKYLFSLVKTTSCKDLLVRIVVFEKKKRTLSDGSIYEYYNHKRYHGYFKNFQKHGFYESEYKEAYIKKDCSNIIQLFLTAEEGEESIVHVMAHEFRHYLQFTKKKDKFHKGSHIEVDASKWANKITNKLVGSRLITPYNHGLGAKYPAIKVWDAMEYICNGELK